MRDSINRRDFLRLTCAAGAGLGLLSYGAGTVRAAAPAVRRVGANEKLTVAVVGTNSRGLAHVECLAGLPGVEIAYICDVDERAVASGIKAATKQQNDRAEGREGYSARSWKTSRWTPSPSPRRTTGTRRWRSWPWRPASMSIWRSRAAITLTRASC